VFGLTIQQQRLYAKYHSFITLAKLASRNGKPAPVRLKPRKVTFLSDPVARAGCNRVAVPRSGHSRSNTRGKNGKQMAKITDARRRAVYLYQS